MPPSCLCCAAAIPSPLCGSRLHQSVNEAELLEGWVECTDMAVTVGWRGWGGYSYVQGMRESMHFCTALGATYNICQILGVDITTDMVSSGVSTDIIGIVATASALSTGGSEMLYGCV